MSRPIVLHICLAFCSLLILNFSTQCLAFPKIERREIEHIHTEKKQFQRMDIEDLENNSKTSKQTPQLVVTEDPMVMSEGPSATSLNKVSPINEGTYPVGARLTQLNGPGVYTPTESVVPASEGLLGSNYPQRMSPESKLSKAMLAVTVTAAAPLNIDEKEDNFSSTNILPIVDVTTEATQSFLKYLDDQFFASESQEEVSLGHSPSSYVNMTEMVTTNLRTEKFEAATEHKATSVPGVEPTAGTEADSLTLDGERPSQTTADNIQATAPKPLLGTSEDALSVEPETDSLPGTPEVTTGVSIAIPTASVITDEWDDTKLESVSQIRAPDLGDNTDSQVGMEMSQTAQVTHDSMKGAEPLTGAADTPVGLPEGEIHTETALLIPQGDERAAAFTNQSSFSSTSPLEDEKLSVVNLLKNTTDLMESTMENDVMFSLETTVSISGYDIEAYQPLGNTFKDIITQEMTTAAQEAEATLSLMMHEQVSTLGITRENGETKEGKESSSPTSDVSSVTLLSRRSDPLDAAVPTTAVPLSFEVAPTVEELVDTVMGPSEELFTSVLGSSVTPPGITEESASISLVLPASETSSEGRTVVPSISRVNTAATYGLDQLESEEGEEDEDEEEEDEEEEDEEEDEEDKDADSLVESLDSDTELLGFTLPGVTSQEPGLEQGNMGLLEGATYQVPDAIEWEQQDQGLVRSWMEKLKDKAGYMSGMLVPVGVGIAGALFILGALYSIKVMNRRRRNGFKRHKRKQREFNSMQDRVMLLADSSEDEF
ncbi:armadillo-like helical domain-containing protein 4 [Orycteropus afer afer]|uniref:Armadillo-like helical domain-containing protein 4 n=1 Tax=Orycteropus afer afer TaxID=1230840 RepID=A0A8B7ARA9_ORYAF|nr:armadillo-like helical domain-containing protein 4 [Orycteropus afer afer]